MILLPLPEKTFRYIDSPVQTERILAQTPRSMGGDSFIDTAGTVTGTWNAASVVGPAGQGIAAGEFAEVIAAIRAGAAYANIHSQAFPAGEIRDQLGARRGHDH